MTLAAIMGGVAGLTVAGGWVNDIFVQLSEALIHSQSGHLQIHKTGFFSAGSHAPEKYVIVSPQAVKQRVASEKGVSMVMARLNFAGLLNNGRTDLPIMGEGVEAKQEAALGSSISITQGRQLSDSDMFGILIGHGVAQTLNLRPGSQVTLLVNTLEGALNSMEFEVTGVFQSFSKDYDARAIRIPLAAAQELLGTNGANALVVLLEQTGDTDHIAAGLNEQLRGSGLEVKTWVELNDFYEKTVELYKGQFGVLQLIILVMVLLSVANSVNMSIFNRVGEFGTMMALGNRSSQIFRLVVVENALLGLIGSGLGLALGVVLAFLISAVGIEMPPPPNANVGYNAQILVVPSVLLVSWCIGIFATVAAAVLPARHVSRMQIAEALRQNF